MSALPQIDPAKVAQKLVAKNGELAHQVAQLEALAEALRDQRDVALENVAELEKRLEAHDTVVDISSLPPEKG